MIKKLSIATVYLIIYYVLYVELSELKFLNVNGISLLLIHFLTFLTSINIIIPIFIGVMSLNDSFDNDELFWLNISIFYINFVIIFSIYKPELIIFWMLIAALASFAFAVISITVMYVAYYMTK